MYIVWVICMCDVLFQERKRCRLLLGDKYSDRDLYFRFDHVRSILTQLGRSHISIIEANNYATSIIQRSEDQKRLGKHETSTSAAAKCQTAYVCYT